MQEKGNKPGKPNGVRIRTVNYLMILMAIILYGLILYGMFQISKRYDALMDAMETHISCERSAALVNNGSDILTEQVRLYVITGEPSYAEAYFQEANVDQKRERALEDIEKIQVDEEVQDYLKGALSRSNELMEREVYAMKLVAVASGSNLEKLPREIQEAELSGEDAELSRDEKMEKAKNLVFDADYRDFKKQIEDNITQSFMSILKYTRLTQQKSAAALKKEIKVQRIEISILFVMNIIVFFFITILIVKPLQVYIKCIRDNKSLEIVGSYEFKYLAITYNDIYKLKAANERMLKNKAEHDPLTGLLNRGAFEQLRESLKMSMAPVSFLLIDVDKFKLVNDQYGHDVGDQVLKKVAGILNHNFRSEDFVIRIGGDEFAVVMTEANDSMKERIQNKINYINRELKKGADGLPPISLSVGVAFSEKGFDDELFQNADKALYEVKEMGRCGCAFYE